MTGKLRVYYIILPAFMFFGCSPMLKTITGIRDIRLETKDDLKKFCIINGLRPEETYIYQPENGFAYPDSSQINFRFADQVLVFNKSGERIICKGEQTGNYCSLPSDDFFSGLNTMFLPLDTVNNLLQVLSVFKNITSGAPPVTDEQADFYLVYYWAKWYPSFSKRNIKSIRKILADADTSVRVQTFYLNNDLVKSNYPEDVAFKKLKIEVSF